LEDEISLRDIIETLLRQKFLIIGITVVAVLVSAILSFWVLNPTYEAEATVWVEEADLQLEVPSSGATGTQDALSSTVLNLKPEVTPEFLKEQITNSVVLERVQKKLNLDPQLFSIKKLAEDYVEGEAVAEANLLTIKAKGDTPQAAQNLANAVAEEFAIYVDEIMHQALIAKAQPQLESQKEIITTSLKEAEELLKTTNKFIEVNPNSDADQLVLSGITNNINPKYDALERTVVDYHLKLAQLEKISLLLEDKGFSVVSAQVISPAALPLGPASPKTMLNLVIALVLGLMVGILAAFFKEYWQKSAS